MSNLHYQFTQPVLPTKNSLQRKLDWTRVGIKDDSFILPSFPSKTLMQIVALIDNQQSHLVSIFEWLNIVEDEKQWTSLEEEQRYDACRAVWQEICLHQEVGDIVFFRIAQEFDDGMSRVVPDLTLTMKVARKAKDLNDYTLAKLDWLLSLQDKNYYSLAQTCFSRHSTIRSLLSSLNLPISNQYQFNITQHLVEVAFNEYTDLKQLDDWLILCVNHAKTSQLQVELFSSILGVLNDDMLLNKTKHLIENRCLPFSDETLWYSFNEVTKDKIRVMFELSNYYSLESVSRFLCNQHVIEALEMSEDESRQIRSRSMFWSNYTQHFSRIKILLPAKTKKLFDGYIDTPLDYVSSLSQSDNDEECEVFIFELESVIIVEMLRGPISETRFYKKNEWNAQRLFNSENISLDDIRSLSHLDVHDHVVGWQYFCEKLLRTTYKVLPDANLSNFKGLPPNCNHYSSTNGLPKISDQMLIERAAQLEVWVERFWAREFKTEKYGEQKGLKLKSNLYLTKAMLEKQCGNTEKFEEFIHRAANQGNTEAMWQLGQLKIKDRSGGARSRKFGEDWIRKAALEGHKDALEAVERYRLNRSNSAPIDRHKSAEEASRRFREKQNK